MKHILCTNWISVKQFGDLDKELNQLCLKFDVKSYDKISIMSCLNLLFFDLISTFNIN